MNINVQISEKSFYITMQWYVMDKQRDGVQYGVFPDSYKTPSSSLSNLKNVTWTHYYLLASRPLHG